MTIEISVILPVYKNAPTLRELHSRLTAVLGGITGAYEIICVNDACPQGSAAVLRELAEQDQRVVALLLRRNVGQNRAVLTGLAHARGNVAVVMDADLQDPPEAIPLLLNALTGSTAAVFAGRRGRYESRGRLLTSWLFKHLLHLLSGRRVPPDAGLFVAMRRETVARLLAFNVPQPYVVGLLGRTGLPLRSIPVVRHANDERVSTYTARTRLKLAWRAIRQILPLSTAPRSAGEQQAMLGTVDEYLGVRFASQTTEVGAAVCSS